jgi:hypothetical protein
MRAPPLLGGVGAGLLALVLLATPTDHALDRLSRAQAERDALTATLVDHRAPAPLIDPEQAIAASNAASARAAMLRRVQDLAKAGGVLIEDSHALPLLQGLAGLAVHLSGPEKAVIALADATERGRPLMRWRRWQLEPIAGGSVRLSGELVAAWQ